MPLRASGFVFWLFLTSLCQALPVDRVASPGAVEADLQQILLAGKLPSDLIELHRLAPASDNVASIECDPTGSVRIDVSAPPAEWAPTFYYALQRLGFLFPHPRIQISPARDEVLSHCGAEFTWRPRVKYRGFHFHTKHPSEWVAGFLGAQPAIAEDTIRWLARNGQNAAEFKLLRTNGRRMPPHFAALVDHAHDFGIHFGVVTSFAQIQQKSYYLITPWKALTGVGDEEALRRNLTQILEAAQLDWITINLGHTEFTSADFDSTLAWIGEANRVIQNRNAQLFTTIHVSTGQTDPRYGEFNFLPQYSDPNVGVMPHTVMFYGLTDEYAPVYGRRDFADMRRFTEDQAKRRDVWYYPETSYFIAMDIDVPLLLTDYLTARSEDYDYLDSVPVQGHLTFTTGQELGYWLFDWTVALLANADHRGRPMVGLELLGEDLDVWRPILEFQREWLKERQLISAVSSSNFLDETSWIWGGRIHERVLLSELACSRYQLDHDVQLLQQAIASMPPLDGVRNHELRGMLQVTWNRIRHAYQLRRALQLMRSSSDATTALASAARVRAESLAAMADLVGEFDRYPGGGVFEKRENLTSYSFGYGWPALTLHFWEREEEMVRHGNWSPFFRNIYELLDMVL